MKDMSYNVEILDVTIRDGSYAINYQYTPGQVAEIAKALDEAGIHYIEVSHGCGLGARENTGLPAAASDLEYVMAAKQAVKKAKIGVIANAEPQTTKENIDAIARHVDVIRFAANCDNVRGVESNLNYAQKLGLPCFFQMMRASRVPLTKIISAATRVEKMGAQVVYLVDTNGYLLPEEVTRITTKLKEKLNIKVGFHGHNNLTLAVANTLAAIQAGCDIIDASLLGIGRAAGNAQLEVLVSIMKRQGLAKKINLDLLLAAAAKYVAPIMPPTRGIAQIDVTTADANIDLYPLEFYRALAKETGVDLTTFLRHLARHKNMTEVDPQALRKTIRHFGGNPDLILGKFGIRQ